jgi:hypothetical protein
VLKECQELLINIFDFFFGVYMAIKMGTPKPAAQDANLTIDNANYSGTSFNTSGVGQVNGVTFNSTGTRMFIMGGGSQDSVFQYNLSSGFDLSTASFASKTLSSPATGPRGVFVNGAGTRLFIVEAGTNTVYQRNLTTAGDLATATSVGSLGIGSEDSSPQEVWFNPTGTKMFLAGNSSDAIYEYNLTTGYDISTASYSNVSFNVSSQDTSIQSVAFNSVGTRMFVTGNNSGSVHQYTLSTGFDLSSASFSGKSFDVSTQSIYPHGLTFNPAGTLMFIGDAWTNTIYQYDL